VQRLFENVKLGNVRDLVIPESKSKTNSTFPKDDVMTLQSMIARVN
jgi:hypothetical protein